MKNRIRYTYKIYCEFIIVSNNITSDEITKLTQIRPSRTYAKGEKFHSEKSGTEGRRIQNLWAVKSDTILSEEDNISSHFMYFKMLFNNCIEIMKQLKNDSETEISFWIWIESNAAGVGIDILETDLIFINEISNRMHLSLFANED